MVGGLAHRPGQAMTQAASHGGQAMPCQAAATQPHDHHDSVPCDCLTGLQLHMLAPHAS